MPQLKTVSMTPAQVAMRDRVLAVMRAEVGNLPADELLAVMANLVGHVIAMQDQRRFTPDAVMALVTANIQSGNRQAVNDLLTKTAGHA